MAWVGTTLYLLMYSLFKDSVGVADCVIECYKDWCKLLGCDGGGIVEGMSRGLI